MRQIRSALPAPRQTIDRRIVGNRQYVTAALQRLQADRRLVHSSPWIETPEGVQVTVRILAPTEPTPAPAARPQRSRWPLVAGVAAGATTLGVAAYAVIRLINAVIALLPYLLAGAGLLALVAVLTASRSRTFTFTGTGRMD
ncbi:hypothetical protein [Micromonospora chersina]|uniref:hypothetical protein n=1 Tax=Micromonospora chersina TaxID=47854 RepID=UPI0033E48A48